MTYERKAILAMRWIYNSSATTSIQINTYRTGSTSRAKEIDAVDGLKGSDGHTDRGRVQLGLTMVDLVSTLPNTIVGSSIGALDVEDQVLHKVDFVCGVDDQHSRSGHLSQGEEEDGCGINLQVSPLGISHDGISSGGVVFGMQTVVQALSLLELLDLGCLAHHAEEESTHQLDHGMLKLICEQLVYKEKRSNTILIK